MRDRIRLCWYWIETKYTKFLMLFGYLKPTEPIPINTPYCYLWDKEKNKQKPIDGYWIKTCKYYRSTAKTKGVACTFVGYFGFDPCLYDQCKICGVNEG